LFLPNEQVPIDSALTAENDVLSLKKMCCKPLRRFITYEFKLLWLQVAEARAVKVLNFSAYNSTG
jgi:hypothetical protein